MRLGFDLDGVFASFNDAFIDRAIAVTGEDKFPPRPFDIPCWDYPSHYGYTPEQIAAVWDDINADIWFWTGLAALPAERGTVRRLWDDYGDHDIYFITSRPGRYAKVQSEEWLMQQGFEHPTVLISAHKGFACKALELDLYVDDKRENCDDVHFHTKTRVFIYDQPWNQEGLDSYTRIRSISEFLARVK